MSNQLDEIRRALDERKSVGGPLVEAHAHCANHREELEASDLAGCFYCCGVFSSGIIDEWTDDDTTALCPKCGIDSVIGDASGHPVNDVKFLKEMNGLWFS